MRKRNKQTGFSFVELSLVLIVLGSILVISAPLLKATTSDAKRKQGRVELTNVMNALKGYAVATGAFPDFPNDGGGADITYQLPTAKLGVSYQSEYQDIIYYDVNDALQFADEADEAVGQTTDAFCSAVLAEIDKLESASTADDPEPRICNTTTSCTPATIADQTSVAVVIMTRARNASLDANNGDGDRVYENNDRGEDDNYDDVMKTLSLYEAASYFGCSDDVSGSWGQNWSGSSGINCGANAPTVVIHNSGSNDLYARQQGEVCWAVSAGNYAAFCNTNGWGASVDVDVSEDTDCNIIIANSDRYTISAASDTSADGDIRISCGDDLTACTVDQ